AQAEMGINTRERHIDRSELYLADECFFTGTAANIAPIAEIDHRTIGTGEVGHITSRLSSLLKDIMLGGNPKYTEWYTLISPGPAES
ncbi:MAG: branched chain amino acid aminotransferase, partial [Chloroflexota bacterium]|nr:branched chain amino acid aminotransferase [Chloroflexota bacterium]